MSLDFIESLAPGVTRLVCPMSGAGSVNGWILGAKGKQMIVDGGVPGAQAAALWAAAESAGIVGGVEAIVCTHMHRDHSGQIPALVVRHRAPLFMTPEEHGKIVAASDASLERRQSNLTEFLVRSGVPADRARQIAPPDYSVLAPFPRDYQPLHDGMIIPLAGLEWRILTGGGHSSKAACLISTDGRFMLAGDQVLGGAGPHITVGLDEPEADLLSEYFAFLDRLAELPDTMAVLPGHGAAFTGVAAHARALRRTHEKRLARLTSGMNGAMSCADMAPLVFAPKTIRHFGYLVPGMVLSLANHLWHRGAMTRDQGHDGVWRFARQQDV